MEYNIFEPFQSGFRPQHSTETALLRVFNHILLATDSGNCVILVSLDLTAAFHTINHATLLAHLEHWVGIKGVAMEWFRSYLSERTFFCMLWSEPLFFCPFILWHPSGVHSGTSALFPLSPWDRFSGDIELLYADHTQIYVPLNHRDPSALTGQQTGLVSCSFLIPT